MNPFCCLLFLASPVFGGFGGHGPFGPGFPFGGSGSGTAISSGSALRGETLTNGDTFTDPFGRSLSSASGSSSGFQPRSTSIATSNSDGFSGFARRKRWAGYPYHGKSGQSTAISTGSALHGTTLTNGQTFSSPFGFSSGSANGLSTGFQPQSTSIANSASNGFGRRKRQIPFGTGSGQSSAISSGNAIQGTTLTNGQTFTNPSGGSSGIANGLSTGYMPQSTSIANSASSGFGGFRPVGPYRKKRQFDVMPGDFGFGGFPMGGFGFGAGNAMSTGNALSGRTLTNGDTLTDNFGNTRTSAKGASVGNAPSSTSIAGSSSRAIPFSFPSQPISPVPIHPLSPATGALMPVPVNPPLASIANALSSAAALQGATKTAGKTLTNNSGESASEGAGVATGNEAQSRSEANSENV